MVNIHSLIGFYSEIDNASFFFSRVDGIVFNIVGPDNTNDSSKLINILETGVNEFAKLAKVKKSAVQTLVVTESLSHKNHRVFYAKTKNIPEKAYKLDHEIWTMSEFLKC